MQKTFSWSGRWPLAAPRNHRHPNHRYRHYHHPSRGENLGLAGGVAVEVAGGAPVPGEVGSGSAACIFNLHSGAEQTFCTLLKRSSGAAQQWKMELKGQQLKLKIIPAIARRTDGFALRYIIPYP